MAAYRWSETISNVMMHRIKGMKRPSWMRTFAVGSLLSVMSVSGYHCSKKTDEEILRERIDTTSV